MDVFNNLSKEEIETLHEAPALVTILVGASDGKLDGEERTWSEKLLRARSYSGIPELQEYYRVVSESFWADLQHELAALPSGIEERSSAISARLERLNPILAKLDHDVAHGLYKGLLGLAEETAKASGGFLRIGAISASEYVLLTLNMLTPIESSEEEENG